MRAAVVEQYGGPEALEVVADRPEPKIGPDWVVVRVAAASINPVDYKIVRGHLEPAFVTNLPLVPGWDVAGEVVQAGPAVRHVHVGQRVVGYARKDYVGDGTWAELVALPARCVAAAPEGLDAAAASCLPLAGLTAYQSLELLGVREGERVLVHAASGGVGHLAVQLARARGARVIGTASPRNHEPLRALGAEPVAHGEGLSERLRRVAPDGVDAVLDLVGGPALALSSGLVSDPSRVLSVVDAQAVLGAGGQYHFVHPDPEDLAVLAGLADRGQLTPHVAERYPLDDVRQAVEHAERGGFFGKLVIEV